MHENFDIIVHLELKIVLGSFRNDVTQQGREGLTLLSQWIKLQLGPAFYFDRGKVGVSRHAILRDVIKV